MKRQIKEALKEIAFGNPWKHPHLFKIRIISSDKVLYEGELLDMPDSFLEAYYSMYTFNPMTSTIIIGLDI